MERFPAPSAVAMRLATFLPLWLRRFMRRQPILWRAFTRLQPALLSDEESVVVTVRSGSLSGFKIALGRGTPLYYWLDGHDEPDVIKALTNSARPGTVAIDVGANIGMETLLLASTVGPLGTVVCVEPDPRSAARLRMNCDLNKVENVELVEKAISNRTGMIAFSAMGELTSKVSAAGLQGPSDILVPCVTIDDLLADIPGASRVSLVKIDVEGHEVEVLEGANGLLSSTRPAVVVEVHAARGLRKCIELLERHDYQLSVLGKNAHAEEVIGGRDPSDSTFVRGHLLALPR
jgi:FkbM family methyltransferase